MAKRTCCEWPGQASPATDTKPELSVPCFWCSSCLVSVSRACVSSGFVAGKKVDLGEYG